MSLAKHGVLTFYSPAHRLDDVDVDHLGHEPIDGPPLDDAPNSVRTFRMHDDDDPGHDESPPPHDEPPHDGHDHDPADLSADDDYPLPRPRGSVQLSPCPFCGQS